MNVTFRLAALADVPAVLDLLVDDALGATRESADLDLYRDAFARIQSEGANHLIVGEAGGRIVATCQLTFISGLSLRAARRAQVESVRVASDLRGHGIGRQMMDDVEKRARAAGCTLIQLTMNKSRTDSAHFYQSLGFTPSHIGYKRVLS